MSTKKKIEAGDTLTVGGLTDDHVGAVIEVGPVGGFTTRLELKLVSAYAPLRNLWSTGDVFKNFRPYDPVKVITPPPVVQPDEPTILGQCIRIEGYDEWRGVVADPGSDEPIVSRLASWFSWEHVLSHAGDRQIIVSDPPRWPGDKDDTPAPGDRFDRIEEVPYGWIASVTLEDGEEWGYVIRNISGKTSHLWDVNTDYGRVVTTSWMVGNVKQLSGGGGRGGATYTLVETAEEHDAQVNIVEALIEKDEL